MPETDRAADTLLFHAQHVWQFRSCLGLVGRVARFSADCHECLRTGITIWCLGQSCFGKRAYHDALLCSDGNFAFIRDPVWYPAARPFPISRADQFLGPVLLA